jgi:hypothetical protein
MSAALVLTVFRPQMAGARVSAQEEIPVLFSEPTGGRSDQEAQDFNEEVIRARQVEVNTSMLQDFVESYFGTKFSGKAAFILNLFEDVSYIADIQSIEAMGGGSFGLVGQVHSAENNELVMVVRGDILQAYLHDGINTYEIRYDGWRHMVVEVNSSAYPASLPPVAIEAPPPGYLEMSKVLPVPGSGSQIDVLAVYTPAARVALGGVAAIETRIQESILSTNQGYMVSGVNQRVNLVGMEQVNYNEEVLGATNAEEWYVALDRLTFGYSSDFDPPTANYLSDARAFRDNFGADLVFMITDLPYVYCGLGWIAGYDWSDEYGYSVVHGNCTGATSYTVQHEMGHNMGSCHDRGNSTTTCMYKFSYGYQQPNQFYTVMAYSNGCGYCTRINRWSNPNLTYNGYKTGVAIGQPNAAHNAYSLNLTASNVANYRLSLPIFANFTAPKAGGTALIPRTILQVEASSSEGSIVQVTFRAYYDNAWYLVNIDDNGADGWKYQWATVNIPAQTISLQAIVNDDAGNSRTISISGVKLSRYVVFGDGYNTRGGNSQDREGDTSDELLEGDVKGTGSAEEVLPPPQRLIWQVVDFRRFLQ